MKKFRTPEIKFIKKKFYYLNDCDFENQEHSRKKLKLKKSKYF